MNVDKMRHQVERARRCGFDRMSTREMATALNVPPWLVEQYRALAEQQARQVFYYDQIVSGAVREATTVTFKLGR